MVRIKGLFVLVGISLVGVILLQIYFLVRDYEAKKVDFHQDINTAFYTAMLEADTVRVRKVAQLLKADLLNPELVLLDSGLSEEGYPKLTFIDPQTDYKLMTFHLHRSTDGLNYLDFLMEETMKNLLKGTVYYWQDTLGELQKAYVNTTPLDTAFLRERFAVGLQTKKIQMTPIIAVEQTKPAQESGDAFITEAISRKNYDGKETFYLANLGNPLFPILKRSLYLSAISLFIILATLASFYLLVRMIRNQKRLAQMKDDFIDNITHELLTPVTTLQMSLESIQRFQAKGLPVDEKYLSIASGEVKRIDALVKKTLMASQSEQPAANLRREYFSPIEVIEQVKSYYDEKLGDKISLSFQGPFDVQLNFDAHHFSKILHNLIDNSVKYCRKEQAVVSVEIKNEAGAFVLEVRDNGMGIPPHHQQRVFDKFHRVSQHDVHDVKGLGLGLYYVRSVLEQVKGEVKVLRSSPDGTVFRISIPHIG